MTIASDRDQAASGSTLPANALCLACNYPLRDLPSNRCPECGRDFDPADAWSMWVGAPKPRLIRSLTEPTGKWWRRSVVISCLAILWGAAWLPGGEFVEPVGWIAVVLLILYGLFRRAL